MTCAKPSSPSLTASATASAGHLRATAKRLDGAARRAFAALELAEGTRVEFDARVTTYTKGYRGHRDDIDAPPLETDFKLSFPNNLKIAGALIGEQMNLTMSNTTRRMAPAPVELRDDTPMPFGKHAVDRKRMKDVPLDYLRWFIANCEGGRWHKPISDYLAKREAAMRAPEPPPKPEPPKADPAKAQAAFEKFKRATQNL